MTNRLSYADLVRRLTNLKHLATLPEPGERTAQWSSYDRTSRYDAKARRYLGWNANGDSDGVIRTEGDNVVLAEMEGPGCLWRIWSAEAKAGPVRIFLDGASDPAVDLPFGGYFDSKNEPFTRPALVHITSQGCNNYTPIPYQKSCKILAGEDWGRYYHFVYTTFPKGTQVPTFSRALSVEDIAALDEADRRLTNCGPGAFPEGQTRAGGKRRIGANGGSDTVKLDGPAAITCLRVHLEPSLMSTNPELLRELTLQIRWDGEKGSSVWTPLGDFFGTAPGIAAFRSLPSGYTEDGWFYANWYMPFARAAEVTIQNEGAADCGVELQIFTEPLPEGAACYGRFHAKWHRDEFLSTRIDRALDWPLLKTEGRGRLVGTMLHVWNPRGGWWGEGDEKFFVDGEQFPSTHGTGSEDYFGYAWGNPALFQNAFHNQIRNDGENQGHISLNRWHIADQIPFQKSFEGCLEKYFPNSRPTLYACTMFWYLEPGGQDPYSPVPRQMRTSYLRTTR